MFDKSEIENVEEKEPKHVIRDLNEESREHLVEVSGDEGQYKSLLKTIARFPSYSVLNAARIHHRMPEATALKELPDWNKEGVTVKEGEKAIHIVKAEKSGGHSTGFFEVRPMFDVSQTTKEAPCKPSFDMNMLEKAFSKVEVPAPTSTEGMFIVGQHFGLNSYLKDGQLPPTHLFAVDDVAEAATNVKNYLEDIRKEASEFIRSIETEYRGLMVENVQNRNSELFQAFARNGRLEERSSHHQPETDTAFDARLAAAEQEATKAQEAPASTKEATRQAEAER